MKRLLAIFLLVTPAWAVAPPCHCSVAYRRPPSPLAQCHMEKVEALATVEAYRDLVRDYRLKIVELEERLAQDPPIAVSPAKAAPTRAKKVRKVPRSKGCKKGRTRNSRGICGRW